MIRRFVSLTLVFSFLLLAASSIMLYVVPEGRVAYWSHWSALSFSKEQWGAMHITGGFMFLIFFFLAYLPESSSAQGISSEQARTRSSCLFRSRLPAVLCGHA